MGRSAPRREEIIDDLLTDCVVEEAAVQAGFAAGEDEVAALVDSQRQTYTDFPEARAVVDSYCEDTGITLEDYWAMAEEQARHTILQAKYQEWFYGEKLPELEISPQDQEGAAKAYAEHCAQLLSQNSAHVVWPWAPSCFRKPVNKKGAAGSTGSAFSALWHMLFCRPVWGGSLSPPQAT